MADIFSLALGVSGLVIGDVDARLYRGGELDISWVPSSAALVGVGGGRVYNLTGLPDPAAGEGIVVTGVVNGVGFSASYGAPAAGSPPYLIIPIRATGVSAGDVGLESFVDGSASGITLGWVETGSAAPGGGDYLASGWPFLRSEQVGRSWAVSWAVDGVVLQDVWQELQALPVGEGYVAERQVIAAFLRSIDTGIGVLYGPNETQVYPEPSKSMTSTMAIWDLQDYHGEGSSGMPPSLIAFGTEERADFELSMLVCQEKGSGDLLIRAAADMIDVEAARLKGEQNGVLDGTPTIQIVANGLSGSPVLTGAPGDQWYGREYKATFVRFMQ